MQRYKNRAKTPDFNRPLPIFLTKKEAELLYIENKNTRPMTTRSKLFRKAAIAIAILAGASALSSCMGLDSLWFGTDFNSGPEGPILGGTIGGSVPIGPPPGGPSGPGPGPGILPGGPGWGW